MSDQNVELVREVFALEGAGNLVETIGGMDPGALRALVEATYTPDVEIRWLGPGRNTLYRGHAEAARAFTDWLDAWEYFTIETTDFVDVGDHVLVTNVQRGTGKVSGVETELHSVFVCTVRDGKIARVLEYETTAEAEAAVKRIA